MGYHVLFSVVFLVSFQNGETTNDSLRLAGTWYYESIEGIPEFEHMNECSRKSYTVYTDSTYHTKMYGGDCKLYAESKGSYVLNGRELVVSEERKEGPSTTTVKLRQAILAHTENRLVIGVMPGVVATLVRKEKHGE